MKRILKVAVAAGALTLATAAANAATVTWDFGLIDATLLSPAGNFTTFIGKDGAITSNGQEAVFQNNIGPGPLFVGANGFSAGSGDDPAKVTQRHPQATNNGETGIGECKSACSGDSNEISTTEWLRISLNNPSDGSDHPGWSLQSIVFGSVQHGEQAKFWFSDDASASHAKANLNQHDVTVLPSGGAACDSHPFGADSCLYDFSHISDANLNDYDYLWIKAANADVLLTELNGTVSVVPEPLTLALFGAGLLSLAAVRRRSMVRH